MLSEDRTPLTPSEGGSHPPNPSQSTSLLTRIIERLSKVLGLVFAIALIIIVLLVIPYGGETGIFNCRLVATVAAFLMYISSGIMIWLSWKKYPSAIYSSKPISHIMQLFLCIATAITLYGYFNHIATERIYWQYDFVLHYKKNKEVENIQDCFYIVGVMIFLLVLLNYLLRVAPIVGIPLWFKCVLLLTFFLNAAQKWLYESIEAHMEMCEELNKNDTLCNLYIHYNTSTKSLSKPQKWLYYATKGLAPLTYTITMELFVACMAIVVHLSHKISNTVAQNVPRMVLRTRTIVLSIVFCLALVLSLLWIIHMAPVLYVYPLIFDHRLQRVLVRLITHISNLILACAWLSDFKISGITPQENEKDPDIIILRFAFYLNLIISVSKTLLELFFLFPTLEYKFLWVSEQIGIVFEILSFYCLMLVAERLLIISKDKNFEDDNSTKIFVLFYSCITLLSFVAYYNLKSLHQFPHSIKDERALNMIVLLQSTYPSTLLFTMTLGFCFGSVGEEFYKRGVYQFVPKIKSVELPLRLD